MISLYSPDQGYGYQIDNTLDKGLLKKDDPAMLAFAYTAPISALIHLCDREPEKTEDAIRKIEAFSRHFIATYGQ